MENRDELVKDVTAQYLEGAITYAEYVRYLTSKLTEAEIVEVFG